MSTRFPSRFFLRLLFAAFGFLSVELWAQTPPENSRPPRLRFLFIDESAGHYSVKLGAVDRPLSANPYEISAPFTPADLKPLAIYKTFPAGSDPTAKPPRQLKIASVIPPANTSSALVIITPKPPVTPDGEPVYAVELIDCDPTLFPAGSIRILNRSPVPMAAQFSDSRVTTAPGEVSLVTPATDSRRRTLCKIAIQVQQPAGWLLIQDSVTVIRPAERIFGLLVYSPGGMRHTFTAAEIAEMGPPKPGCFWLTFSDTP